MQHNRSRTRPDHAPQPVLFANRSTPISGCFSLPRSSPFLRQHRYIAAELRLDVDGWYPQEALSCTLRRSDNSSVHIVARLKKNGRERWRGTILKTFGGKSPFTKQMTVALAPTVRGQRPKINFTVTAGKVQTLTFTRVSPFFHPVRFEYDRVERIKSVVSYKPQSHPVRPPSLKATPLDLSTIFRRAGFDAILSSRHDIVPIRLTGQDRAWNDRELHDAMQAYWSCFSDKPQWSLWVLFANLYSGDFSVGGIMFDTLKKTQRRGVALFDSSPLFNPPSGDPAPDAWNERIRFWTACHEIGHLFNLAHSWQKTAKTPWVPLKNDENALSFMNYPFFYNGGATAFFADFMFRFDDDELLFMRHAPEQFVQMGNAAWNRNHAFSSCLPPGGKPFSLELRMTRSKPFTFMEPVMLECKLKNISSHPQNVGCPDHLLAQQVKIAIKREGTKKARVYHPFTRYDIHPQKRVLEPGESFFAPIFASADVQGWIIADPGKYIVQAYWEFDGNSIVSNPLRLDVIPPADPRHETLAQDYFCDEVARVLAFDGSNVLTQGNACLQKCIDSRMPPEVVRHARIALAAPLQKESKTLSFDKEKPRVRYCAGDPDRMKKEFEDTLFNDSCNAAETLGNLEFKGYVDKFTSWLVGHHLWDEAQNCQQRLYTTLKKRKIKQAVLQSVLRRVTGLKKRQWEQ